MRRLYAFIGSFTLLALVVAQTALAQNDQATVPMTPIAQWPSAVPNTQAPAEPSDQPVVPASMTPIAQWPPAIPNTPLSGSNETSLTLAQTLGIGNFSGLISSYSVSSDQPSLAEAARETRLKVAKDHLHVFTNDDLAQLHQAAREPSAGIMFGSRVEANEQTMPASDITTSGSALAGGPNPNNAPDRAQSNGIRQNASASDQTTPPAFENQPPAKNSAYGRK